MPIKASTGPAYSRIEGIGAAVPSRVVDNHEMTKFIETSDEWIQQRTGIVERRWVAEGESVESLSLEASRKAMEHAGVGPGDIDGVIVATSSHKLQTPSLAVIMAGKLGIKDAAAFDTSAACAGFAYGLAQADALVRTGAAHRVLVVGSDTLSTITDLTDRATAFLFADGAGAVVVGPSDVPSIGPVVWGSDAEQNDAINMNRDWDQAVAEGKPSQLTMNGPAVFRWATTFIADATRRALEVSGLTPEELDLFVPHQANNRIIDAMLRHLKLPENVTVARTIRKYGNSSAASIPVAIAEMVESGEAKSGDTCLIMGFGAGLVYAGQVITIP